MIIFFRIVTLRSENKIGRVGDKISKKCLELGIIVLHIKMIIISPPFVSLIYLYRPSFINKPVANMRLLKLRLSILVL